MSYELRKEIVEFISGDRLDMTEADYLGKLRSYAWFLIRNHDLNSFFDQHGDFELLHVFFNRKVASECNSSNNQALAQLYECAWYELLGLVYKDRPHDALVDLRNELSRFSEFSPVKSNFFLQAICLYRMGCVELAYAHFLKGSGQNNPGAITPIFSLHRGVVIDDGIVRKLPSADSYSLSDFDFDSIEPSDKYTILSSACSRYVSRFLEPYFYSVIEKSDVLRFHAHLILIGDDFDDMAINILKGFKSRFPERFSYTVEEVFNMRDKLSYYAFSRFLVARDLVRVRPNLIITDMDYILKNAPDEFLLRLKEKDVYFQVQNSGLQSWFPFLSVTAGTVLINKCNFSKKIIDDCCNLFFLNYVSQGQNWGIDQCVLSHIYHKNNGLIGSSIGQPNPFTVPLEIKRKPW